MKSVDVPHLRERLEDGRQHLQRGLPAGVELVLQLRHHKVDVLLQLLPQRVVQQVLQVDLQKNNSSEPKLLQARGRAAACLYLLTVNSDHGVAPGNGQLGHFVHHLLHLWDNELPGQDRLEVFRTHTQNVNAQIWKQGRYFSLCLP